MSSAVAQQALKHDLHLRLNDPTDRVDWVVRSVSRSLEVIKKLSPELQKLVRSSYAIAMRWTFFFDVCLVAGAMLISFLIEETILLTAKEVASTAPSADTTEDQP